ncbi:MAG TPA: hypothetical protein DCR93_31655 [Cytophagales bacterium]|nr:hypothetical protein [Cytophagales bacterium]HAP63854.1 hypothetical protein [Cytophagales bacterium]
MEKVVTIARRQEKDSDKAYWSTQSYTARLAALEVIREDYFRMKGYAEPRLHRVCRVIKKTSG